MIEEDEAIARVLEATPVGPVLNAPLIAACGLFARRAVYAKVSIPAFDNSAVDGFALGAGPRSIGSTYNVIGEQAAGRDQEWSLSPGEAVRIFTGAPLPRGTEAVLMKEESRFEPQNSRVYLTGAVEIGEHIRQRGADLCSGQKILAEGDRLTPQRLSLLASQGISEIAVSERPRVTIISTGDELALPGQDLHPGEIYESNGIMLEALALQAGASEVRRFHVKDEAESLARALDEALKWSNYLILSGGVSVGDRDYVKGVLSDLGCQTHFWRVNMKPGKPTYFGTLNETLVFGLPGNPVASYVTFLIFCRRSLLKWMGSPNPEADEQLEVTLLSPIHNRSDRPHYIRGKNDPSGFTPIGLQESHGLASLCQANALIRVAEGTTLSIGEAIRILPLP